MFLFSPLTNLQRSAGAQAYIRIRLPVPLEKLRVGCHTINVVIKTIVWETASVAGGNIITETFLPLTLVSKFNDDIYVGFLLLLSLPPLSGPCVTNMFYLLVFSRLKASLLLSLISKLK
jgi:hypothetical protein